MPKTRKKSTGFRCTYCVIAAAGGRRSAGSVVIEIRYGSLSQLIFHQVTANAEGLPGHGMVLKDGKLASCWNWTRPMWDKFAAFDSSEDEPMLANGTLTNSDHGRQLDDKYYALPIIKEAWICAGDCLYCPQLSSRCFSPHRR